MDESKEKIITSASTVVTTTERLAILETALHLSGLSISVADAFPVRCSSAGKVCAIILFLVKICVILWLVQKLK
nr:hypothetical protein BSM_32230 [uncultured archaeon]